MTIIIMMMMIMVILFNFIHVLMVITAFSHVKIVWCLRIEQFLFIIMYLLYIFSLLLLRTLVFTMIG